MKKFLLLTFITASVLASKSQVLLNEVYPDPGAGKSEFFELYNSSVSSTPLPLDNYTLICFFETPAEKGFCVMDLPNLTVSPKGYFVGAATLPFSYQGINNSTAADFSWNSSAFTSNNGYIKRWVQQTNDLTDGNPDYDESSLPGNFNDFFQRRTGSGASFTVFLYKDGTLINAVCLGTGGNNSVISSITSMPALYIDMSGSSADFTIDFSTYGNISVETVSQDAGSDNGFIREADGACGSWTKSSSQVQHTPQQTNGYVTATMGVISTTAVIQQGDAASGSNFIYDVIAAPVTSFPVELQVYKDDGNTNLYLDAGDEYVESNFENTVTDGPFTTNFSPYDMNMLLVVISNAGCIDKVLYAIGGGILPVNLVYFKGEISGNDKIALQWKVAENGSVEYFDIEQSSDGVRFIRSGSVTGNGIQGEQVYDYTQPVSTKEKLFYRLKIVGKDHKNHYSTILSFKNKNHSGNSLQVIDNPVRNKLSLSIVSTTAQGATINIHSMSGQLQTTKQVDLQQGENVYDLSLTGNFTSGVYIVEMNTGKERLTAKFVKQ